MSTQPDLEQPWFIRQVHQRNWGDPDDDNVLPMRKPPVPEAEPLDEAGHGPEGSANAPLGYRPSPEDPNWLDWTAPPSDPRTAHRERRDLRLPVMIGLVLLVVLLAFGAGWLLRDRMPVPGPVSRPVVPPAVTPTQSAPILPAEKIPEVQRPPVEPTRVAPPVVEPAQESAATAPAAPPVAKPVQRKAVVQPRPAKARGPRTRAAEARATGAVPAARTPALERQRREEEALPPRSVPEAAAGPSRAERADDAFPSSAPTSGAPSDLLAGTESRAAQPDDEGSPARAERRREREMRRAYRALPRCVGFQIYRPNIACRAGGPR